MCELFFGYVEKRVTKNRAIVSRVVVGGNNGGGDVEGVCGGVKTKKQMASIVAKRQICFAGV